MPGKAQNTPDPETGGAGVSGAVETKEEAMRREYAIKHMTRRAKLVW